PVAGRPPPEGDLPRTLRLGNARRPRPAREVPPLRPIGRAAGPEGRRIRAVEPAGRGESPGGAARVPGTPAPSTRRRRRQVPPRLGLQPKPPSGRPPRSTAQDRERLAALLSEGAGACGWPNDPRAGPRGSRPGKERLGVASHPERVGAALNRRRDRAL